MKFMACLSVFCGCFAIGLIIYVRAKNKVRFYTDLIAFCRNLVTEISFTLTPIVQIIDKYQNSYSAEFIRVLSAYRELIDSNCDITREKCLQIIAEPQTADFFYNLGRHGSTQEKEKLVAAACIFMGYKNEAEGYLKTKASIALKILIIMGIAGVILLL
jgi:hypothetical protein